MCMLRVAKLYGLVSSDREPCVVSLVVADAVRRAGSACWVRGGPWAAYERLRPNCAIWVCYGALVRVRPVQTWKETKAGDKESGQKDSKDELSFGYKADVIADANYGLPMLFRTRPANASDVTVMIEDLDACLALYPELNKRYFLGDKGYDIQPNIQHVVDRGILPLVGSKAHEGLQDRGTAARRHSRLGRQADVRGRQVHGVH